MVLECCHGPIVPTFLLDKRCDCTQSPAEKDGRLSESRDRLKCDRAPIPSRTPHRPIRPEVLNRSIRVSITVVVGSRFSGKDLHLDQRRDSRPCRSAINGRTPENGTNDAGRAVQNKWFRVRITTPSVLQCFRICQIGTMSGGRRFRYGPCDAGIAPRREVGWSTCK